MKTKFNKDAMFSKIKGALEKKESGGGSFANFMKFKEGNNYRLRLLPTLEEGKDPLYHHYVNGWKSTSTGSYTSVLSLRTFGVRDPIGNVRYKEWKAWKDANPKAENKEYEANIKESENWLVNVLVMEDPVNEDNVGKVKILKMGPQLKEIVDLHLDGVKSKKFGVDIFIPTEGFDLVIVAEEQGIYTTYKNSFFESDGEKISDKDLDAAYENLHDLEQVYPVKTVEELEEMLEEHYFAGDEKKEEERKPLASVKKDKPSSNKEEPVDEIEDDEDEIPFEFDSDDETDELLAGLED